jgi:hypothetical protein
MNPSLPGFKMLGQRPVRRFRRLLLPAVFSDSFRAPWACSSGTAGPGRFYPSLP